MSSFENVITALVTPFYKGEIDGESFARLLDQQLAAGITRFVINGTTGESPTVEKEEVARLFGIAKKKAPHATLILGTGSNSTVRTIEATAAAKELGADAALVVVPYYNRPSQEGLFQHFKAVAEAVDLPLFLYNVPTRTGRAIEMATVARLSRISEIYGVKDASGNLEHLDELKKIAPPFVRLSGDDESALQFCAEGGHGVISVVSHLIPKEMVDLVKRAKAGDANVHEEYGNYKDLIDWTFVEANPVPVKWALAKMGIIRSAEMRLPLVELDQKFSQGFETCLTRHKLI